MISRRRFIGLASTAVAAGLVLPRASATHSAQVRVAVVGLRIKGFDLASHLVKDPRVRLTALCDVDPSVLASAKKRLGEGAASAQEFADYRLLLEKAEVDAVVVATPNHLHTLQTLLAIQAGKAVYVEKPVSHTIEEGRALLAATVADPRAIVQVGTQRRSDSGLREAFKALRDGELGKILVARALCHRLRKPIGLAASPPSVPKGLNLDLFCGPAPLSLPKRANFHYDWHWFWETGNGEIGNQGPHELDLARLAIGASGRPRRVLSFGGRFGPADDGQTPNSHVCLFEYPEAPILMEIRGLPREFGQDAEDAYRGIRVGVVVDCEQGWFAGNSFFDRSGKRIRRFQGDGGSGHLSNFIDAVLANDPSLLNAPLAEAIPSNDLVHFGNIAYRCGRDLAPSEVQEQVDGAPLAKDALERLRLHLTANQTSPEAQLRLGGWLEWSEAAGRFTAGVGHEQANGLIGREYRAPWALPVIRA